MPPVLRGVAAHGVSGACAMSGLRAARIVEVRAASIKTTRDRSESPDPLRESALTPRERAIVRLLYQGWSNKRIAEELRVTVRTVKNRLTVIYHKVGVRTRVELLLACKARAPNGD